MKKEENCKYCYELESNCVCTWSICAECKERIPESITYEYRGRLFCEKHDFDEQSEKRESERRNVMEITEHSVESQRRGEFVNNRKKYHSGNVAADGLPIMKIQEPMALKEYESPEKKEKK